MITQSSKGAKRIKNNDMLLSFEMNPITGILSKERSTSVPSVPNSTFGLVAASFKLRLLHKIFIYQSN